MAYMLFSISFVPLLFALWAKEHRNPLLCFQQKLFWVFFWIPVVNNFVNVSNCCPCTSTTVDTVSGRRVLSSLLGRSASRFFLSDPKRLVQPYLPLAFPSAFFCSTHQKKHHKIWSLELGFWGVPPLLPNSFCASHLPCPSLNIHLPNFQSKYL